MRRRTFDTRRAPLFEKEHSVPKRILNRAVEMTDRLAFPSRSHHWSLRAALAVGLTTVVFAVALPVFVTYLMMVDFYFFFPAVLLSSILGGVVGALASVGTVLFWTSFLVDLQVIFLDLIGFLAVSAILVLLVEALQRRQIREQLATEQRMAERMRDATQIAVLSEEVAHRCKNLLAVVLAIAENSWDAGATGNFKENFKERMRGLARSHDLVEKSGWAGVSLREVIDGQIGYLIRAGRKRVVLDGPDISLQVAAAQSISMAMYELATNAIKYGALSNSVGIVRLSWSITESHLRMSWEESGGPLVRQPNRTGFGQKVVKKYLEHSLDAIVKLEYKLTGVQWSLYAPVQTIIFKQEHGKLAVNIAGRR